MKHRLHVPAGRIADETKLVRHEASYLGQVLRLSAGDRLEVFDGEGRVYPATITRLAPEDGVLSVGAPEARPSPPPFVLVQGLPKGDKMELVIQKATELGVTEIRPVACARSVVRLEGDRAERKTERWQRIAAEAARQSGRADLPRVHAPAGFADAVAEAASPAGLACMIARVDPASVGLRTFLSACPDATGHVLAVGPEGGFTPAEVEAAKTSGFTPVSLGDRVLRTETVALAVLAAVRFHLGELG